MPRFVHNIVWLLLFAVVSVGITSFPTLFDTAAVVQSLDRSAAFAATYPVLSSLLVVSSSVLVFVPSGLAVRNC